MALEALVGSILGELVTLTAHSLHGSLGVAWGLTDKLETLQRLMARIQSVLANAEERQIRDVAVRMWLDALKKTAYDAEVVVDQFNYEILRHRAAEVAAKAGINNTMPGRQVRDFFSSHNQILFRMKMGRKLKNILNRIVKIESEGRMFNLEVSNVQPETAVPMRETSSFVAEADVVGRNEDREKLVKMLTENSENLAVLPIVGMGGLGKTTMAQLIYNDPRVMNCFQLRGWVCVSDQWDMTKIIQDLIVSITKELRELPNLELKLRAVREALMGKRYLIVLDDIWEEDRAKWDTLRSILDCGGSGGSTIIVTTRSKRVAQITGTLQSFDLSILSESESWTLFSSKSFAPDTEKPEELVEVGKAIVNKCGGLPLAIKMLGSLLYMKSDRNDWLKVRDSSLWNMEENDNILPALRLSYKHLPPYTKRCFAFCATFRKDVLIEKEMLIQMWMANGFIPSGERLDVKGHEIFNQLVQRSFLHDMEPRELEYEWGDGYEYQSLVLTICSMHDLVHDLAQSIVGNECKGLYKGLPEESTPKDVYHLSVYNLVYLDMKEMMKAFPNLRTLKCNTFEETRKFPQYTYLRVLLLQSFPATGFSITIKFLQHMRYLQLNLPEIKELPDSIGTLYHLQTLDLFQCQQLGQLPESICTLLNLQTLNLCWCIFLCELPERMQCMSGLRNLYLDRCFELKKMPAGMGGMTNLQTLTRYVVSDEDGRGIKELKGLNISSKLEIFNLRYVVDAEEARQVKLHSKDLRRLTLCWRETEASWRSNDSDEDTNSNEENGENVLEELKPPGSIEILKIWDYKGLRFPAWMMGCLRQLVRLHLGYCTRIHRLPPLWRLNSLEVLSLRRLDNLKYIISDDDDAAGDTNVQPFPSLKTLKLYYLESLEDWSEKRNADQALAICFPSLVNLEIEKCPELAGSTLLLSCVKDLKLEESSKIRLAVDNLMHLQSLEKLIITKCEEVVLMSNEMTGFGSSLKDMTITECDWMFSSRASGLWGCMASLERLWIDECHALDHLFDVLQGLKSLRYLSLRFSPNVSDAATSTMDACLPPQLERFYFQSCKSLTTLMLRYPVSLKYFGIWDCPNLVSLTVAAEQELGQFPSLNLLEFSECTALMSLPESLLRCLPSLEELTIRDCPGLEKKCKRGGEYWHLVSKIPKKYVGGKKSTTTNFATKFLNFLCRH